LASTAAIRAEAGGQRQNQQRDVERFTLDARTRHRMDRHLRRLNNRVQIERHIGDAMCKFGTQREVAAAA
jgi:hypothetical protein